MTQALAPGYGGGYAVPTTEEHQSWVAPVAAGALTGVALLGVAAVIRAVDGSSRSGRRAAGRCYREAVERLFENRLTYTEQELQETLFELTVQKFQQKGSRSHSHPLPAGLSRSELAPAARASMVKSLQRGLSPRKMERFLNNHVRRLRDESPSMQASLREFKAHGTKCADLSPIDASTLFPCEEVKRYIVLSFRKHDPREGDPAHFDPILHIGREWVIANASREFLLEGEATRDDAKRALDLFASRKYGDLRKNGVHTIFSERA